MFVVFMRKGEIDEGVGGLFCLLMVSSCFGLIYLLNWEGERIIEGEGKFFVGEDFFFFYI